MKYLNIQMETELYDKLIVAKGNLTWLKFFEKITE